MAAKKRKPKVRREVEELSLLFEVSQILEGSLDLREVVGPVLKALATHTGMLRGILTLLNRETKEISIESAYGLSRSQKERGKYRLGQGLLRFGVLFLQLSCLISCGIPAGVLGQAVLAGL